MKPRAFEELAFEYWAEIPDEYKRGIDGLRVLRRSKPHDELPDVYTLGECLTESYPSDFGGPDTTRSAVVLYHGSFEALARLDPDFDWEEELWETLTHELRHHLESLADEDALENVDFAADENFKRYEGEPFDPSFYRMGEPVRGELLPRVRIGGDARFAAEGWRVEGDWFFELRPPRGGWTAAPAQLEWMGATHSFELPDAAADYTFAILGGGFAPRPIPDRRIDEVAVVLVREPSLWRAALDALRARRPSVEEIELDVTTTTSAAP